MKTDYSDVQQVLKRSLGLNLTQWQTKNTTMCKIKSFQSPEVIYLYMCVHSTVKFFHTLPDHMDFLDIHISFKVVYVCVRVLSSICLQMLCPWVVLAAPCQMGRACVCLHCPTGQEPSTVRDKIATLMQPKNHVK